MLLRCLCDGSPLNFALNYGKYFCYEYGKY